MLIFDFNVVHYLRQRQKIPKPLFILLIFIILFAIFMPLSKIDGNFSLSAEDMQYSIQITNLENTNGNVDDRGFDTQVPLYILFGFDIKIPEERNIFQSCPDITFAIINPPYILQHLYQYQIFTHKNPTGIWVDFIPLNENYRAQFIQQFRSIWEITKEGIPITWQFRIDQNNEHLFEYTILKDNTPPSAEISLINAIPSGGQFPKAANNIFRQAPILMFDLTDNLCNLITIHYIVNNHNYSYNLYADETGIDPLQPNPPYFLLPEWESLPEGEITVPIWFVDTAQNSVYLWLQFYKDSIAPSFSSNTKESWIRIGNNSVRETLNPITNSFQLKDPPVFYLTLADLDISSIRLYFNLSDLEYPWAPFKSKSVVQKNQVQLDSELDKLGNIFIEGEYIEESSWKIALSKTLWSRFGNEPISMNLVLIDTAENIAIYSFLLERLTGGFIEAIENIYFILLLLGILSVIAITFLVVSIYRNQKNYVRPFEDQLKRIDLDLLDVVLEPMDLQKAYELKQYLNRLGPDLTMNDITRLDLQDFLKTPIQLADIEEIRDLIVKYKMDPIDQELFLREMLALGPEQRREFIKKYMEHRDE